MTSSAPQPNQLDIQATADGAAFGVKVAPRASREEVRSVEAGALKVMLTAPPVEGAANKALVKLLAKQLGVAKGRVKVIAGEKSRAKRVLVQGLAPGQVLARLGL